MNVAWFDTRFLLVRFECGATACDHYTTPGPHFPVQTGRRGRFVLHSNIPKSAGVRGINGTELVDLILKCYEDLSGKHRKMIPLKMVYIPVSREEPDIGFPVIPIFPVSKKERVCLKMTLRGQIEIDP